MGIAPAAPADRQPDGDLKMALRSDRLDAIVSLSKRRGFVYPSSEIYGGLRASWDYGPLGVELKNNIKRQWWRSMVTERDDIVGGPLAHLPGQGKPANRFARTAQDS